jgi:hypothetical protein
MATSIDAEHEGADRGRTGHLGDEAGPTAVALQFEYAPKGGPIGNLSGKVLDKQFTKGFHGYYTDLDSTATQHSTSCPAPSTEPPGSTNATALFPVAR